MFEKQVVIDCKGHLLGRLASIIAKEILNGQKIVAVRCEDIVQSGCHYRNKLRFSAFLRKRMNTNPKKGPIHFRAPSRILWRTVRGMVPHKTARGAAAMERLKVFEGVPPPYDKMKRMVVPQALRVLRLKPKKATTNIGRLSSEMGWNHLELVKKLEEKRKVRSAAYYARKKALARLRVKAATNKSAELTQVNKELSQYGC